MNSSKLIITAGWRLLLCCLFLVWLQPAAAAQSFPASGISPLRELATEHDSGGIAPNSYRVTGSVSGDAAGSRIGPDDLLDISVFEAPEMNRSVRVSANGEISLDLLGPVMAAGLTPSELESVLRDKLRLSYMKDPHVNVFVRDLESHPVTVIGAVKKPGVYQIQNPKPILEVLSLAEGLGDDAGDRVLILRRASTAGQASLSAHNVTYSQVTPNYGRGEEYMHVAVATASAESLNSAIEQVNVSELLQSGNLASNVMVYPGDIVKVVPTGVVYVIGEVHRPGGFVLKNNRSISVLQALSLAEGVTHTSAGSQSRIIRTDPLTNKRIEIPVSLGKILANKTPDPELQAGDILFVPNSAAKSALYRAAAGAVTTASGIGIYKW